MTLIEGQLNLTRHMERNADYNKLMSRIKSLELENEALKSDRDKFRELFDDAPLGIFRATMEGKLIEVNRVLSDLLGYKSPKDLLKHVENTGTHLYASTQERIRIVEEALKKEKRLLTR
ncbi:MAG: PAS domain-containing protein [Bacteroidales bacterium]|nr:PAS domain-containing protein [Bacteroidales bacterium]